MTMKKSSRDVSPGRLYRLAPSGFMLPVEDDSGAPDVWVCRRTADYAPAPIPAGAAFSVCTKCHAAIAFNPARTVAAPKICMQCAGVTPLPMV